MNGKLTHGNYSVGCFPITDWWGASRPCLSYQTACEDEGEGEEERQDATLRHPQQQSVVVRRQWQSSTRECRDVSCRACQCSVISVCVCGHTVIIGLLWGSMWGWRKGAHGPLCGCAAGLMGPPMDDVWADGGPREGGGPQVPQWPGGLRPQSQGYRRPQVCTHAGRLLLRHRWACW